MGQTQETIGRSVAKTISWRIIAILIIGFCTYLFSGKISTAGGVGLIAALGNMVFYFIYERIWASASWGATFAPHRSELKTRSLVKNACWHFVTFIIVLTVNYIATHRLIPSLYATILGSILGFVFYYPHERIWNSIRFGQRSLPERDTML